MLQIRSSSTLDGGDFGWLKARHHFAVSLEVGAFVIPSIISVPIRYGYFRSGSAPRVKGGTPQWHTRHFPKTDRANQMVVLASGLPKDGDALPIRADARVLGATLLAGARIEPELGGFRHAYARAGTRRRGSERPSSCCWRQSRGDGRASSHDGRSRGLGADPRRSRLKTSLVSV